MAGGLRTVLIDGGTGASASNEVQAGFARLSGIATALARLPQLDPLFT